MTVVCVPVICQNDALSQNVLKPIEVENVLSQNVLKPMGAKNNNKIKSAGVNTIGPSARMASHDLKVVLVAPKFIVSPWSLSNIEPDVNLHPVSNNSETNIEPNVNLQSISNNSETNIDKKFNMEQYLPQECYNDWFEVMPEPISVKNRHLIDITKPIGVTAIGSFHKTATYNLRAQLAAPKFVVSPWNQSSIKPDLSLKSLF